MGPAVDAPSHVIALHHARGRCSCGSRERRWSHGLRRGGTNSDGLRRRTSPQLARRTGTPGHSARRRMGPPSRVPGGPGTAGARVRVSAPVQSPHVSRGPSGPQPTPARRWGLPAGALLTSAWPAERHVRARAPRPAATSGTVDALSVTAPGRAVREMLTVHSATKVPPGLDASCPGY